MDSQREQMIVKNLPLVSFVVSKMSDESGTVPVDREEAIAYGIEGLIQAVNNYDPTRGTTFASFAIRRIRGSILDAHRRMDILPRSLRKNTRELDRANFELAAMLGRWPTSKELALKMGLPEAELHSIMTHSNSRVVSLEKMMGDGQSDGSSPWEASDQDEYADPAAATEHKASIQLLSSAVETLAPRDKQLIQLRYQRSLPFHEIARMMSLSESRVCQIHKRILSTLKKRLNREVELAA
jgi:RNA polymerase sigma factor for flagellar operon FliA